jgi:hypothetical protein
MPHRCWTHEELQQELERYRAELRRSGLADDTIKTYSYHPGNFVAWLADGLLPKDRGRRG